MNPESVQKEAKLFFIGDLMWFLSAGICVPVIFYEPWDIFYAWCYVISVQYFVIRETVISNLYIRLFIITIRNLFFYFYTIVASYANSSNKQ